MNTKKTIAIWLLLLLVLAFASACSGDSTPTANENQPDAAQSEGNNQSSQTLFQQANDYYQAGNFEEAIEVYQQALEQDPNFYDAYANLGAAYYNNNQLDLAQETYEKAVSLSPDDADVAYNLGAIYLQQALSGGLPDQEKLQTALDSINRAIELDPGLPQPYYGLGVAHQQMGNTADAITAFETFLELDDQSDPQASQIASQILQQLKAQ